MRFIINNIVMLALFLIGITLFTISSFNKEFILGLVLLLSFFIGVNLYGIITRSLTTKMLVYLIGVALLFVAGSVFGNYGVEQKAIGYSTLYDFSLYGVAISILLIFMSSFFFVLGLNAKPHTANPLSQARPAPQPIRLESQSKKPQKVIEPGNWEEASIEDIESGEYSF